MSSGVRFTVAVIVVAMFAVGLYYARLEKPVAPAATEVARTPEPSALETGVTDVTNVPTPPTTVADAASPVVEQTDSTEPAPIQPENPPSEEAKVDDVEAETEVVAPSMGDENLESVPSTPAADETMDVIPELTPELVPEVVPTGLANAYGPSLGVRKTGVSLLSAVPVDDGRIDQEVARSNLQTDIGSDRPAGPQGTIWIPLAFWNTIRGAGEVEGLVVGTRPKGDAEQRFLLVRDDSVGGLRLDGRISGATVREDAEGRPEVAYRLESDAVDEVRESTFDLVGGTIAWIVDGEIVSTPTLRIAIQNRGHIVGGFDREHAAWIAARLRGELMAKPGTVVETPDERDLMDEMGEAPSASGLPEDAYTPYTIQAGDNFELIAENWFGDPRKQSLIALANPTVDPLRLQLGQVIKLPPKNSTSTIRRATPVAGGQVVHTVQSGETLSDISLEYLGKASRWREIHDANRSIIGDDPGNLQVGMEIVIP